MKRIFNLAAALLAACLFIGSMAGCTDSKDSSKENPTVHICESPCTICGKCTDETCKDPVCTEKCEGHTYYFSSTSEELHSNNKYNSAYIQSGVIQQNILTLNGTNGTYSLVKRMKSEKQTAMSISVQFTFCGVFTKDGSTVTLKYPEYAERNSDWGLYASLLPADQGKKTSEEDATVLYWFPTAYFVNAVAVGIEQKVTVDEIAHTAEWQEIDQKNYGNSAYYDPDHVEVLPDTVLKGKTICYLGSSVTLGASAENISFVEFIAKRLQTEYVKEAVSGTTLADNGENSYISRLKRLEPQQKVDLFVCQLSTNDASAGTPLGSLVSEGQAFDTKTVYGAIEWIITYVKEKFDCPIVFYTNAYYENEAYAKMVEALATVQKKYDIGVIDLYTDEVFNEITAEQKHMYMADEIHPTKAGYLEWWTPVMENELCTFYESVKISEG